MRATFPARRGLQQVLAAALGASLLGTMMPYPAPERAPEPRQPAPALITAPRPLVSQQPVQLDPANTPGKPAQQADEPSVVKPAATPPCARDMVLVEGEYCTQVEHTCQHWLDDESLPFARCGEYAPEARCVGKRIPKRFCIDRFESAELDEMPVNQHSFHLASKRCRSQDKRLCTESEWNFACEGESMLPYPYGLKREAICNQDRSDLFEDNPKRRILKDLRQRNDIASRCVSPFGVYNMVGNLDEPVRRETGHQPRFNNALKGGWWMAGRNRCRPATTAHDDYYRDIQIGVRCCADAVPE